MGQFGAGAPQLMKHDLVEQVKSVQRSTELGKLKWEEFWGTMRTGNRDPIRYTAQALQMFLENYQRGEPFAPILSKVLRLRGVPFQSELQDVVRFLAEYGIDGSCVVVVLGPDGRKTGEVYVTFPSEGVAERVLQEKQRQEINGRYIEIFRASEEDREEARAIFDAYQGHGVHGGGCGGCGCGGGLAAGHGLAAHGRGSSASFGGGDGNKEALVMEVKQIQRSSTGGRERWQNFCEALRTGNRDPLRHSCETLQAFIQACKTGADLEQIAFQLSKDSRVVRLRGVPWQASLQDVVNFLAEYQIPPQDVTMINRPDGKPTGETFILFPTPELAQRAIAEKANKEILGRYIETFRSCESELEDYKRVGNSSALPQYNQAPPPMEQAGFGSWGGPPSVFDQPWGDWGALPGQQAQATQYEWAQNGASTGNAFKDELVDRVKQIQRSHDDGKTKWEQYCLVQGTGNRDPARHTVAALTNFLEAYSKGEMPSKPAYSAVLRLRGVPFQSELSDVLAFLTLYGINESQIVIGRTPDGRKTGEAFVTFPSVEMAEAALQEKQKKEIHGRYIEVFRSSEEEREQARVHHDAFLRSHGGTGGINKEALVAEVKHIQRSSDDGRIRWDRFCDTLNTGNRDPTRHTCEALRAFSQAIRCGNDVELAAQQICVSSTVVRLRGVPFQGGTPDVLAFLAEYSVREPDITFIKKPDGRSTGEAFVMFQSPQLAEAAIEQKQRQEIQGRYIELFRSSQAELEEYKRRMESPEAHLGGAGWIPWNTPGGNGNWGNAMMYGWKGGGKSGSMRASPYGK